MFKKINEWLTEKGITTKNMEEKSADELAAIYNDYNEYINAEIEKALDSKVDSKEVDKMIAAKTENMNSQLIALNKALKDQGLAIKQVLDGQTKTVEADSLKEALTKHAETLKNNKLNKSKDEVNFVIKAPATMTIAGNVSGGNIPVEDRLEGFNVVPTRTPRMLDFVSTRTTTANVVSWVYQANKDGSTAGTAEGNAKNQVDFDLVVANEAVKKITNYIKISDEMLDDITWIEQEVRNELLKELLLEVEDQVYQGANTATELNGITNMATSFSPTTAFATNVVNPNVVDVLVAAMDQIESSNRSVDNLVAFLAPSVVNKLLAEKAETSATDTRYNSRLVMVGSTLTIDGRVPIVKSTLIDAANFLIGDMPKDLLVTRSTVDIQIGLDADDFTKNLRTVRAEWRGLNLIKNNDRASFIADVIATSITAITKP